MADTFAGVEALERRRLFVNGTAGNDVIEIQSVNGDPLSYRILLNGAVVEQKTFAPAEERLVGADGLGGDDLITVDGLLDARALLTGGEGNDTIVGGSRYDIIHGNAGDDLIFGKGGGDSIGGGAGNDTIRGGDGFDDLYGDADTIFDSTSDAGDDVIFGEGGDDILHARDGDDILNGGDGNDELFGGFGDDLLLGADGDDRMRIVRSSEPFVGDAELGNDTLDGGAGSDRLLISSFGAPFYLTLDGVANDGKRGDHSNVTPTFENFDGASLGDGSVIDLSLSPVGVSVSANVSNFDHTATLAVAWIGSAFDDNMVIAGATPLQIDGRAGNDTIHGSDNSNDQIFGGPGNDSLFGGGGKDSIVGEDGDDHIEGGFGNDRIAAGLADDVVYGDDSDPFGTTLWGSDTIEGNAGNDVLVGGGNNDVILGEGGRDTIIGGGGNDRMYGGPDAADKILGGTGDDSAAQDDKDTYDSVENFLT